jgi:hypothetical protein
VDIEPPTLFISTLALFSTENNNNNTNTSNSTTDSDVADDVLEMLRGDRTLYQTQYDSIDLRWNVANVTWMAGSLPNVDDWHEETEIIDDQVHESDQYFKVMWVSRSWVCKGER